MFINFNIRSIDTLVEKIVFVVGFERLFSLVFDPTLTQKTLNQTSV